MQSGLCVFGGNMKLLIRKECLHYCQKENKKISRFQSSFQIWFRQVVLKKFEIPYLELIDYYAKIYEQLIFIK